MLQTPGMHFHLTENGMECVSYSIYPSNILLAKTHGPCLKADGKRPDQPDYLKDSKTTAYCLGN